MTQLGGLTLGYIRLEDTLRISLYIAQTRILYLVLDGDEQKMVTKGPPTWVTKLMFGASWIRLGVTSPPGCQ